HLGELWNLFQFLNPGLLGSWQDFKARYMVADRDERNSGFLRDLIQPFILRRTKEEVLDELPEKIIYEQTVRLSPEEMQVYEAQDRCRKQDKGSFRRKEGKERPLQEGFRSGGLLRRAYPSSSGFTVPVPCQRRLEGWIEQDRGPFGPSGADLQGRREPGAGFQPVHFLPYVDKGRAGQERLPLPLS
ncbi:MAG: hypothetical protein IJ584_01885, partial [Bacteroidales bacterium]|nr:hypothetical protein [Bacteroidales bacterium]